MGTDSAGNGSDTDEWGAYLDDGYPQAKHRYTNLCEMPAAWGGGSRGSLLSVGQAGGIVHPLDPSFTHGKSTVFRFDLSQTQNGHSRLTGSATFDFGNGQVARVNDAAFACKDLTRQGWWVVNRPDPTGPGWGQRFCFVSKTGTISTLQTPAVSGTWASVHHFDDDDSLCLMTGGGIYLHRIGTASWSIVPSYTGTSFDLTKWNQQIVALGYVGLKWSTILNCFVGFDHRPDLTGPQLTTRVWRVTPPPLATRYTAAWNVVLETLTSNDGSTINGWVDQGSTNGSWGKLVEAPLLKSFVWTRNVGQKGQLFRLQGMV
jgi:hypothetical protein